MAVLMEFHVNVQIDGVGFRVTFFIFSVGVVGKLVVLRYCLGG